jgi:hypothetical protein
MNRNRQLAALDRREILKLLTVGGLVHTGALFGCAATPASAPPTAPDGSAGTGRVSPADDGFIFLQLSDTHWGFEGPPNPQAATTLREAIGVINRAKLPVDFVVFTGDLTHTTPDPGERRRRLREFQTIISELDVKRRYFLPGEHDADQDGGAAYRELFGETHYAFDHGGVHFVALDNVSGPGKLLGEAQLDWLASDLERVGPATPIVVLTHRPLFELFPAWDWMTGDGNRALALLARHPNVSVFYGHIHQEHHFTTGKIQHHAARSLVFPLPAPGSVEKKAPLPWDAAANDHGLGYRSVRESHGNPQLDEHPLLRAAALADSDGEHLLRRYCVGCHNPAGSAGEEHDFTQPLVLRAQREAVLARLNTRSMPPSSAPRPTADEQARLMRWVKEQL